MNWEKFFKSILYPHIVIVIILLPISTSILIYSLFYVSDRSMQAYISYALAFYTLTIYCLRIPELIKFIKKVKKENKYIRKWNEDLNLRSNISLFGSSLWNGIYAIFQLWLGFYHKTFWYYSFGCYYICLSAMRFYLNSYFRKYKIGERMDLELKRYRFCGEMFLVMNLALASIIFFMIYWNRTFQHHMIITIAMATYTFVTFTLAIIAYIKYSKYNSPILSASKIISLTAACVSMLTLESTMLNTFGGSSFSRASKRIFLGITGVVICVYVIVVAVYMIVSSTKKIKRFKENKESLNEY